VLLVARRFGSGLGALERLLGANQAVADLTQPTLAPLEHAGLLDGQVYLVRSHEEGQTLYEVLASAGSLDMGAAVEIAIGLCEALAPAHQAGLVHGSLSPYCVLVGDDAHVHVTDTGLLPALQPVPAPADRPWGRFPYLTPEQAASEDVQPASDVYAIGSLLYHMLAGRPPFRSSDEGVLVLQHLRHDPPSLQVLVHDIPPSLAQIVHKALAKEPAARYRNAGQLAHILRSLVVPELATLMQEMAAPQPVPERERLVVPPPPAVSYRPDERYEPVEAYYWHEESEGMDWLLVGLIIAALIAVLGLIPLWRTVYDRYALPSPVPAPGSQHPIGPEIPVALVDGYPGDAPISSWLAGPCIAENRSNPRRIVFLDAQVARFGSPAYGFRGRVVVNCECES
jgi:serine/threonine protein kinase